jgi:hypothetical protein
MSLINRHIYLFQLRRHGPQGDVVPWAGRACLRRRRSEKKNAEEKEEEEAAEEEEEECK